MLQRTIFLYIFWESILYKNLLAWNAQLNYRDSFTLKFFKYLENKKFQTFPFLFL